MSRMTESARMTQMTKMTLGRLDAQNAWASR